jgi:phage-related baseplate assembly protein
MLALALVSLTLLVVQASDVAAREAITAGRLQTAADALALAAAKGLELDVLLEEYEVDTHDVVTAADENGITATVRVVRVGRSATATARTPTLEVQP